jgi:hypothetical protein
MNGGEDSLPANGNSASPWVEARNRVSNDHEIRIHENLTDHEDYRTLTFYLERNGEFREASGGEKLVGQ